MPTAAKPAVSRDRRVLSPAFKAKFLDTLEDAMQTDLSGEADGGSVSPTVTTGEGAIHIHIASPAPQATAAIHPATDVVKDSVQEPGSGDGNESRLIALESGMASILAAVQKLMAGTAQLETPKDGDAVGIPNDDADPAAKGEGSEGGGEGEGEGSSKPPFEKKDGDGDGKSDEDKSKTKDCGCGGDLVAAPAKTEDSASLQTSFNDLMADAEVIVPGFKLPTFDVAAKRATTIDSMCSTRKRVLEQLANTTDGASFLSTVAGSEFNVAKADTATTAVLFRAVAGAKRSINNAVNTLDAQRMANTANVSSGSAVGTVKTLADLNKLHAEHYAATSPAKAV